MKIGMIGHKRIPSREGGVEIVVGELATRLQEKGHEIVAYNRKGKHVQDKNADPETKNLKEYHGVRLISIPTINKKGLEALVYSFLASIRAAFGNYDIIHYHAEGSCGMLWIPHLFRKKIVVTIHGLDWKRSKWGGFATRYIRFGEKMAVRYADEIIVLSKDVERYFRKEYGRKTNYIPNGITSPELRKPDIIQKKHGLVENEYILFLARIVPEKGLHYLIKAFKEIKIDKKLVIAGGASHTNEYLEEIKELAKSDPRIIFTGFVQGKELDELFSNCYLYCLPSDVEGMPISLLEAMSYGCRCLTSDIQENRQVTGAYGNTFEKSNIEDLTEALSEMLKTKNPYTKEEISSYILGKYSWEDVVQKTLKIYQKS